MKIKNLPFSIFAILLVAILALNSCTKDFDPIAEMPESFTKKVLIEEFTAEWCGACPSAAPKVQTVVDENPNTVFAAALHVNDPFDISATNTLRYAYGVSSFPSSMVDRYSFTGSHPRVYPSTSSLRSRSTERLGMQTDVGLKIETEILENGNARIKVFVGYNKLPEGNPRVTTYILENGVPQVNQAGTSNPDYKHDHVIRNVLTDAKGSTIKLNELERVFHTYSYDDLDISDYNKNNLEVIAFVHYFDENDLSQHEIINVQKVKLGKTQDWD